MCVCVCLLSSDAWHETKCWSHPSIYINLLTEICWWAKDARTEHKPHPRLAHWNLSHSWVLNEMQFKLHSGSHLAQLAGVRRCHSSLIASCVYLLCSRICSPASTAAAGAWGRDALTWCQTTPVNKAPVVTVKLLFSRRLAEPNRTRTKSPGSKSGQRLCTLFWNGASRTDLGGISKKLGLPVVLPHLARLLMSWVGYSF